MLLSPVASALAGLLLFLVSSCGWLGGQPVAPAPTGPVATAAEAAARVIASDDLFAGIERKDAELIGQGSWWTAKAVEDGWTVRVRIGWGDCMAGCIAHHEFTYHVTAQDGAVTLTKESGTPIPDGGIPSDLG